MARDDSKSSSSSAPLWRTKTDWVVEPMTLDLDDELCLYPIQRPEVFANFNQQKLRFWTDDEIIHATDRQDWENMNSDEQNYIALTLAFFANSDNAVMKNINTRFRRDITWPEVNFAFSFQAAMECIHVVSYNNMIDAVISDPHEKRRLFHAVKTEPIISEKIQWITRWASDPETPLVVCFAAQCFAEGIGFSPSFASMFWLRANHRCPGICFGNEKIVEDESLHVRLFAILYRTCVNRMPRAMIEAMCREFVEIEHRFVDAALPYNLSRMNKTLMKQYVCVVADAVLREMGEEPLFGVANPFDFMNKIGLLNKSNFFEKRVGEYQKRGVETNIHILDVEKLVAKPFDI